MRLGLTLQKVATPSSAPHARRFRELARKILPEAGIPGADHVLIGRPSGIERPFADLETDLRRALAKVAK